MSEAGVRRKGGREGAGVVVLIEVRMGYTGRGLYCCIILIRIMDACSDIKGTAQTLNEIKFGSALTHPGALTG